jgi:hypothetical protein
MSRDLSNAAVYENFFESDIPALPLPMVWRVVYNEAIRGNHILFDAADLLAIETFYRTPDFRINPENSKDMTKFAVKFFGSSDFRAIKSMVKELTLEQKVIAFVLYRRSINDWQAWLKRNLN